MIQSLRNAKAMRRVWLLLAISVLVFVLGLAACGSSDQEPTSSLAPSTALSGDSATTTSAPAVSTTAGEGGYTTVDVQTAYEGLSANEEAQLVDVREPAEWGETGVPVGALLIPLGEIEQRAPAELAKDKPVYVICRSGNRSRTASEILIGLGYTDVFNVDGGIKAWIGAGLPVEPYKP